MTKKNLYLLMLAFFTSALYPMDDKKKEPSESPAKKTGRDLNAYNKNEETPLSIALRKNTEESHERIKKLLDLGADPNRPATTKMWTPLMIATRQNDTQAMQMLLDAGANEDIAINGKSALQIAQNYNCSDAEKLLLSQPLNKKLMQACINNNAQTAHKLIDQGANGLLTVSGGNNLAHIAVKYNAHEVLTVLTQKTNIDLDAYNQNNETPLSIALRKKNRSLNTIQALLNKACPNRPATKSMWTPLMIATRQNDTQAMQILLDAGANENITINKKNALQIALQHNYPHAADILLTYGAKTKYHPFQLLFTQNGTFRENTEQDYLPILQVLKKHGINFNQPITIDQTTEPFIIHLLRYTADIILIEYLLIYGAQVDQTEIEAIYSSIKRVGLNPNVSDEKKAKQIAILMGKLHACLQYTKEIYKMPNGNTILIQAIEDKMPLPFIYNIITDCPHYHAEQDTKGQHALHHIALLDQTHPKVQNLTLKIIDTLSACLNIKDHKGRTPLMLAQEDPEIIARMLLNNANVNVQDKDGDTSLIYNIMRISPVEVDLLEGTQQLRDTQKRSPIDMQKIALDKATRNLNLMRSFNQANLSFFSHIYFLPIDALEKEAEEKVQHLATIKDLLQHNQTEETNKVQKESRKIIRGQLNLNPRNMRNRQLGSGYIKLRSLPKE
ncbi:MAG: ankyrin repeat domain-containing protein [Candidatus Dependentiae bacterium]